MVPIFSRGYAKISIESFLRNWCQSVTVNGISSNPQEVISGVPPGSVLCPLIFLILIGDIDQNVIHSIVMSFADDTKATKSVKSIEDGKMLQNDLQSMYNWIISNNNMELNDVKFGALQYGRDEQIKRDKIHPTYRENY